MAKLELDGWIVDLIGNRIFSGQVVVEDGHITSIKELPSAAEVYILPGFIDAHVHIESSMLIPSQFARLAVCHGTVAAVSDPHEIANVMGIAGVKFMLREGKKVPFKFCFGAPSCVPATPFESSGAELGIEQVEKLLAMEEIGYLSEVMNFPGVINNDEAVMAKIAAAKKYGKPIDGHAPGLSGEQLTAYADAGITTDHECFTKPEAVEKISAGMKVLIREGSAARNFDDLVSLISEHSDMVMFCSDDKHPDELAAGHINQLVVRSVKRGCDPLKVLRAACLNPVEHYCLDVGLLQEGDQADFIVVKDLVDFEVQSVYLDGKLIADKGRALFEAPQCEEVNRFVCAPITEKDICCKAESSKIRVIEVVDGQLVTNQIHAKAKVVEGNIVSDSDNDILKLIVLNRYAQTDPAVAFVKNIGLKKGAIASSVAHDSHNIVAVGTSDQDIVNAVNLIIDSRGGISAVDQNYRQHLPLPVAGLMSTDDGRRVAEDYQKLDLFAKELGSALQAPFMTLSFLALLVIPSLKLSDKGLFDGDRFEFTSLFVD